MTFNFLNQGQSSDITQVTPIDTFIDPVSKIRVSNPGNLIDTDFEYGLQPTKWETVEIINNTPAFFSKSGDTTISDITGVTTNSGTREITVTTAFPHLLDVGIPIRVAGTKSLTADGSYIINATPTPTTFTYLSRANQNDTVSIFDLYTSIITGEFFQGSQISISDSEGITTDGAGPNSTLTVKTSNKHGFGPLTPFYFLNLNSTVSQEFESQNTTSLSFDPTNSATAQTFDGSNTLIQTPIDLSNSATTSIYENSITSTDPAGSSITISIATGDETNWSELQYGQPLYHDVNISSGYFQSNPRGVVFIKSVAGVDATNNTATFQVSEIPDGDPLPVLANMTGYFKIADQARTFAGNNVSEQTEIEISIEVGSEFIFDGGNQGYDGEPDNPISGTSTVVGYTGTTVTVFTSESILDYYVGSMLEYVTDGTPATGLSNNTTYFVRTFEIGQSNGLYNMTLSQLPGPEEPAIEVSGGSGNQQFKRVGVSLDKDIVHVKDSNFQVDDMLEYSFPESGRFVYDTDQLKKFFFVVEAYDSHNYVLADGVGFKSLQATGGDAVTTIFADSRFWTLHTFTTVGTSNFEITQEGEEDANVVEALVVGGGGAGGNGMGAGGGGGGVIDLIGNPIAVATGSYSVVVGNGGFGTTSNVRRGGENSSAFGLVALGGGGGSSLQMSRGGVTTAGENGGSGGGSGSTDNGGPGGTGLQPSQSGNAGIYGFGNNGGNAPGGGNNYPGGGGGGSAQAGESPSNSGRPGGKGGDGRVVNIDGNSYRWGAGGGGGSYDRGPGAGDGGLGGAGGGSATSGPAGSGTGGSINSGQNGSSGSNRNGGNAGANTGSGGGGASWSSARGGNGGSGFVAIRYPLTNVLLVDDIANSPKTINATGGDNSYLLSQGNALYVVHEFTTTGTSTFDVTNAPTGGTNELEYLIVGGGGAGGNGMGAGGGAGGVVHNVGSPISVSAQPYTIVVGNGGAGTSSDVRVNGQDSSAFGLTALGGGGASSLQMQRRQGIRSGANGGSGGGSGASDSPGGTGGTGLQPSSSSGGFGNNGGNAPGGGNNYPGGGGGGSEQAGQRPPNSNSRGGKGGDGIVVNIDGNSYRWGAGGGGGCYTNSNPAGAGGAGGGGGGSSTDGGGGGAGGTGGINNGQSGTRGGDRNGGNAGANTGSGGGGASWSSARGGNGGSGIVIIRYKVGQIEDGRFAQ